MSELKWELDRDDARFLDAVRYYDGQAAIHEIRGRTGLTRGKTDHRFNKLADLNLIEVTYQPYKSGKERVAHLTGVARREIEKGLLADIDDNLSDDELNDLQSKVRSQNERIDCLESRVDVLTDLVRGVDAYVRDLDDDLIEWSEQVETEIFKNRTALRDE